MKYISTRGGMEPKSFCEILLGGLAPDGGLVVPESYPRIDAEELQRWRGLSYQELAFEVISRYVDDIPAADLRALINKTYTAENFGSTEITPVRRLDGNLYLVGLSNGPTLAFKDVAMQLLGNLFEYVLEREGRTINILGATSGDTGSAAEYAMRGKARIKVFMLSPFGKMSPFQRAQMFSLQEPNIFNIAVKSMFDSCQDMVKAVNNDAAFKADHAIGAVNSINWGRVVAQMVYYFKAYFAATQSNAEKVSFVVPSGNFGNVCAGHIARMMGLPVDKFVVATNENDVLDEFFKTGRYHVRDLAHTYETSSPSMDITKASNLERFVFDLVDRNPEVLRKLWRQVETADGFDLPEDVTAVMQGEFGFRSGRSTHANRIANIRQVYERYGVEIDPHTADGYKACMDYFEPQVPTLIMETALPAKFESTMEEALGRKPARPAHLQGLEALPQRVDVLEADVAELKAYVADHSVCAV